MPDATSSSPWLGAAIGGGSSLLGDIFNLFGQSKANREQEQYNINVMNQQRQWSLQDIAAQNAYNSPVQQMQRLKEAGLNPNLVYGEGIQAAGTSDMPRSVPAPSFNPGNVMSSFSNLGNQVEGAIDQYQNIKKTTASVENVEADTANKRLTGAMQEMENAVKAVSPEINGLNWVDSDGTVHALSPKAFAARMKSQEMEGKDYDNEIKAQLKRLNASSADMAKIQADISAASKSSSLTAALAAGKQALATLALTEQQKKNLDTAIQGMLNSQRLQQMEIEYKDKNFGNNPILQQFFHMGLMAILALL